MARDLTVTIPPREDYNFHKMKNGPILQIDKDPVADRDLITGTWEAHYTLGDFLVFKGDFEPGDGQGYAVRPLSIPIYEDAWYFNISITISAGTITDITITRK